MLERRIGIRRGAALEHQRRDALDQLQFLQIIDRRILGVERRRETLIKIALRTGRPRGIVGVNPILNRIGHDGQVAGIRAHSRENLGQQRRVGAIDVDFAFLLDDVQRNETVADRKIIQ